MNDNKIAIVSAIGFTHKEFYLPDRSKAIQHERFEVHGLCPPRREFDKSKSARCLESVLTEAVQ